MPDSDVLKESRTLNRSGLNSSFQTTGSRSRGKSAGGDSKYGPNLSNEWIPTEAVRAIQKIKEQFGAQMTETCVSQILYELNSIWRAIMRKENDALKRKLTEQIQDLRRQLITKKAFDEEEAAREISRLKKELVFVQKQEKRKSGSVSSSSSAKENKQRMQGKASDPNLQIKSKIEQLEKQRLNLNADVAGLSNSDDISQRVGKRQGAHNNNMATLQDADAFSGKNIFNYNLN